MIERTAELSVDLIEGGMDLERAVETVGRGIDVAGILIIVVGAVATSVRFVGRARRSRSSEAYSLYRRGLGRAILLGLEFLVAGDIIRTVAISPTLRNVGVLGAIVAIRTFLSVALHVETEAVWPWQARVVATVEVAKRETDHEHH